MLTMSGIGTSSQLMSWSSLKAGSESSRYIIAMAILVLKAPKGQPSMAVVALSALSGLSILLLG